MGEVADSVAESQRLPSSVSQALQPKDIKRHQSGEQRSLSSALRVGIRVLTGYKLIVISVSKAGVNSQNTVA
ncbi:hypothetical protein SCA6_011313 [Theobroma cacao]